VFAFIVMMVQGKREFSGEDIMCANFFKNVLVVATYSGLMVYIIFISKLEKDFGVNPNKPNAMKYWLMFEVVVSLGWVFSLALFMAVQYVLKLKSIWKETAEIF
jgi:hypothetical protein